MEEDDFEDLDFINEDITLPRDDRWKHKRINWPLHVKKLLHEKSFNAEYRMSYFAYQKLCFLLDPFLSRQQSKSRCDEPITTIIIVACSLRILAGGKKSDQKHIFGLSKTAVHSSLECFIDAVSQSKELDINIPFKAESLEKIRHDFTCKSHKSLFNGCVGCIDGFFQETICPTKKDSLGNVVSYYSGHYESYGLNCQAVCDANLKFWFFGVVAPGKTNDNAAFPRCTNLYRFIENLPVGTYVLGDAAYTLQENLLVPFVGSQRDDANLDAFNFYLSQLRIRIEMSFGRLVRKWQILKSKLCFRLSKCSKILITCAKLHNYVIDQQMLNDKNCEIKMYDDEELSQEQVIISRKPGAPLEMEYLPILPNEEFEKMDGMSMTRIAIVDEIRRASHRRPVHNLQRNANSENETNLYGFIPQDKHGNPLDTAYFNPK